MFDNQIFISIIVLLIGIPILVLFFIAVKNKLTKLYFFGLNIAMGSLTNKKILGDDGIRYIQYNNHISRWIYTYIFPNIYRALIILIPLFLLFVRPNGTQGYALRQSGYMKGQEVMILDDSFSLVTGELTDVKSAFEFTLDTGDNSGIILGTYVEKEITPLSVPGILLRSMTSSIYSIVEQVAESIW